MIISYMLIHTIALMNYTTVHGECFCYDMFINRVYEVVNIVCNISVTAMTYSKNITEYILCLDN